MDEEIKKRILTRLDNRDKEIAKVYNALKLHKASLDSLKGNIDIQLEFLRGISHELRDLQKEIKEERPLVIKKQD